MPAYTLPYTGVIEVPANTILGNNTGSAAAAIGLTQAQTLTFLGNPGGAFGADVDTQITPSTAIVLDHATNNEVGLSLSYTTNKAAGNDTGLLIAMTDTASPGTSLPLDVQVGGSSKFKIDSSGDIIVPNAASASYNVPTLKMEGYETGISFTSNGRVNMVSAGVGVAAFSKVGAREYLLLSESTILAFSTAEINGGSDISLSRIASRVMGVGTGDTGEVDGELRLGLLAAVAPAATDVPISITGAAAQSANLFEIGANGGSAGDVFKIDSAGDATFGGDIAVTGTVDGRDIAADGTTLDGLTSAAGLTTNNQTVTATDITGAVSQFYVCTITGLTANRNLTLPSGSAGDRIGVHIVDGDDTYALILKGAASQTINGGTAATEWSRLFIKGETVIFRCTAANTWVVESDGRIPQSAKIRRTTDQTGIVTATQTKAELTTSGYDNASIADVTTNYRITVRRAGKYLVNALSAIDDVDSSDFTIGSIYLNGVAQIRSQVVSGAAAAIFTNNVSDVLDLAVDDYLELFVYHNQGADQVLNGSFLPRQPLLGVDEIGIG